MWIVTSARKPRRSGASKGVGEISVGRIALPTRAIVRLEGIIRRAIRPVVIVAPLYMGVAFVDTVLVVEDRAANHRASGEGCKREPKVAVTAVAATVLAVTAVAVPVHAAIRHNTAIHTQIPIAKMAVAVATDPSRVTVAGFHSLDVA